METYNYLQKKLHRNATLSLSFMAILLIFMISGCQDKTPSPTTTPTEKEAVVTEEIIVRDYFVTPDATDGSIGTIDDPMTLTDAIAIVEAGQTIHLRGGSYVFSDQLSISESNNGKAASLKQLFAYQDEEVIFDFSSQPYNAEDVGKNPRGLKLDGSYWHIKRITVYGAADNGFLITGSNNIIEDSIAQANKDTGFQISRRKSDMMSMDQWPSHNLILNCTSFDNADPDDYEDADGFAAKLTSGEGNVFDGCIAYNNVDDGWDLFTKTATGPIGSVTIKNSLTFNNGATTDGTASLDSDGNGFKLGGTNIPVMHTLINCVAFNNKSAGFTDNSNPGVITLVNCTAYNNSLGDPGTKNNFDFAREAYSANGFVNLLSYSDLGQTSNDKYRGFGTNSILYNESGYYAFDKMRWYDSALPQNMGTAVAAIEDTDFMSLTPPDAQDNVHETLRNQDGSVNLGDFLTLTDSSLSKTYGVDGMPIGAIFTSDNSAITWPTPPEQSPVVVENMAVEEALLEAEDASKSIPPQFYPEATEGLIYIDGFDQATDETLFTPDYLANSNDPTIPLYIKTGGTPNVVGGYLILDSARMSIGASYLATQAGIQPDGTFDLSKPYRLTIELAAFSGLGDRNFMVYIDNNTAKMNNSLHKGPSKIYEVPVKDLLEGDLVLEPEIGTEHSLIQVRVETGVKVVISKISLEYID